MARRRSATDARRHTAALAVGAAVATVPAGAGVGIIALSLPALRAAAGGAATVSDLVVTGCALTAGLVLAWLAVTVLLAALDEARARGRRAPRAPSAAVPVAVRRLVALAVGLAIGSSAVAAGAAPRQSAPEAGWATSAPAVAGSSPVAATLPATGLPEPGWASAPVALAELPGGQRAVVADDAAQHVVQRGDSLWALAQQRCGPDAGAGDVTRELHRLHALNLDVVGDDPDLLLPGQVLRLA